jgi:hypothetical protein
VAGLSRFARRWDAARDSQQAAATAEDARFVVVQALAGPDRDDSPLHVVDLSGAAIMRCCARSA